jgi:hypothetical protein
MNLKNQIEKLKQELREFLELSKAATKGPWKVETSRAYRLDDDFTHNVIGPPSDFMYLQEKPDATFIARSRNISPAMAECLLVAVEALEWMNTGSHGNEVCDNDGRLCRACESADATLQQILTLWEASK